MSYRISFKLSEKNKDTWEKFCKGNMAYIQSDEYKSLLETILEDEKYNAIRSEALKKIKRWIAEFWSDRTINYPRIERKDITHCRRIIYSIEKILFPELDSHERGKKEQIECIFELDLDDAFVLLCSVYLHDYGKGQYRLILRHIEDDRYKSLYDKINKSTGSYDLDLEEYGIIENYHTYNLYNFIETFLCYKNEDDFIKCFRERYKDQMLNKYIDFVKEAKENEIDELKNAGTAQKWLFRQLWILRHQYRCAGNDYPLLKEIQLVSCAHKSYQLLLKDANGISKREDFFDSISESNNDKLSLLAALLRIGDNLDFTRERIEDSSLKNFMKDWMDKGSPEPIVDTWIDLFAVWLRFLLVEQCSIRHNKKEHQIEIVIKYKRFTNWQKHFFTIRAQVEKDFMMTNYLHKLNRENVKLVLSYELISVEEKEIEFEKELGPEVRIEGQLDRFFAKLKEQIKRKLNKYQLISLQNKSNNMLEFSPLPPDISLPTNRNLLYLLIYYKIHGSTSRTELKDALGIAEFATIDNDNEIVDGKLLFVETNNKLVRCTDESNYDVDKFMEVYWEQPRLVRQKVLELEQLGFLLPFSPREADLLSTGIPGLDGILNPYCSDREAIGGFKNNRNILVVGKPGTGKTTLLIKILYWNFFFRQRNVLMLTFEENFPIVTKTFKDNFNWDFHFIQSISPQKIKTPEETLAKIHEKIKDEQPDIVAIDGLSRLSCHFKIDFRDNIDTLFKALQMKGITGIFSIEEPQNNDTTIEYQADGIIHLYKNTKGRELEIEKLRSQDFIDGRHAFEIIDQNYLDKNCTFSPASFKLTQQSLTILRQNNKIHEDIPKNLEKLVDQSYATRQKIIESLEAIIGKAETEDYKDLILQYASDQSPTFFPFYTGINVYPNENYYATISGMLDSGNKSEKPQYIPTGIRNLDNLLPGIEREQGFRKGNSILIMGSPGAGKTLFGLHFLKAEFERHPEAALEFEEGSHVLWLSFEGSKRALERGVASFDPSVKYLELIRSPKFIFKFIPPALISPEKVLYYVSNLVVQYGIERIVIDSVSEIEQAFEKTVDFRQYMTTFIHILSNQDVTTMFLYRIPGFFRSTRESESDISTLVDTIISIKTFDMKNEIRRGLFVLKSRGGEQRSQLQTMEIDPKNGILVSNKGWEMEGLLSGDTGNIREPAIFLKLFYENPAEQEINREIIEEFKRRYPDRTRFTEVRKPAIYSEFWSFRGDYGAGHSNIRIVSISMYMVEAFRELNRLHEMDDFFPDELKRQIEQDFRWKRYCREDGKHDNMPIYNDLGFLVVQKDIYDQLRETKMKTPLNILFSQVDPTSKDNINWAALEALSKQLKKEDLFQLGNAPCYLFSLPYINNRPEFMAFFIEILWSKGGDIYHFPIFNNPNEKTKMSFYKEQILLNKAVWKKFVEIIQTSIKPDNSGIKMEIYKIQEMAERVKPLTDYIVKHFNATPPVKEQTDKDFLNYFVELVNNNLIENKEKPLPFDDDDVITINNKHAREALGFIYDLVFDSGGTIPNPYDGDFSVQSIFCRKWYSHIEGFRRKIQDQRFEGLEIENERHNSESQERQKKKEIFKVSQQTLDILKRESPEISEDVLKKLEKIEDKEYRGEKNFINALHQTKIAAEVIRKYSPLILEHSRVNTLYITALPCFKDGEKEKTCLAETVWSLGIIKEALSPEIGWIFIDTLSSKEWVEKRAANKEGFPHRFEDVKQMEHYDPDLYKILLKMINNNEEKEHVYSNRADISDYTLNWQEFSKRVDDFFIGQYHQRDIGDILKTLKNFQDTYTQRIQIFEDKCSEKKINIPGSSGSASSPAESRTKKETDDSMKSIINLQNPYLKNFKDQLNTFFDEAHNEDLEKTLLDLKELEKEFSRREKFFSEEVQKKGIILDSISKDRVSELSDFEEKLTLRSKIQAHRPFYHRVESILHEEIVKLFSPKGRNDWYFTFCNDSGCRRSDDDIEKKLKEMRDKEKNGGNGNGLIKKALDRMHDRLIFDLLTSLSKELQKIW